VLLFTVAIAGLLLVQTPVPGGAVVASFNLLLRPGKHRKDPLCGKTVRRIYGDGACVTEAHPLAITYNGKMVVCGTVVIFVNAPGYRACSARTRMDQYRLKLVVLSLVQL